MNHSIRALVMMLLIGCIMILPTTYGEEPEQSFQWTLDQWQPYTYKEPADWVKTPHPWIALAINIPRNTFDDIFQIDSIIQRIHFDTTKFDANDPTSLYRAISHIRLDTGKKIHPILGTPITFKIVNDDLNVPFRINKQDFVEFLIKNNVYQCYFSKYMHKLTLDDSDIPPDGKLNNYYELIVYLPEYSQRDQLIQELEAKEYIFNVEKRKWQDPY